MDKKYNIHIKRITAMAVISAMLGNFFTCSVYAAERESNDILKQSIYEATRLLEDAIETSMKETEESVKRQIVEKEYDYYTTMETFYRCDNPYIDADYLEMLAAYAVVKEEDRQLSDSSFYELPYTRADIITTYSWEYIPVVAENYVRDKNGKYYVDGKIYIEEPQTIQTFEKTEGGGYRPIGTREIEPKRVFTKYGDVRLKGIKAEDVLCFFGLDPDAFMEEVQEKKNSFERIVNGTGLKQSMFIESQKTDLIDKKSTEYIKALLMDETIELPRRYLIDAAVSLVGKVPYEWGGKADRGGYDTSWWTIDETGNQKGLDCSGFVQWAFMTAGFTSNLYEKMISTDTILKNTETISISQLKPGDLGLINNGQAVNHVGIYLGNNLWVHCSSKDNTVVVADTGMFKIFKRMPFEGEEKRQDSKNPVNGSLEPVELMDVPVYQAECGFTEQEIYLTAQLVYNEAVGEGLNGWIAVAEVVLNRVNSDRFPDSVEEVIYQDGQFSHSDMIRLRQPPDEMIKTVQEVFAGNMKVFDTGDVLFFRNAGGSTEDWGSHPYFDTVNSHQFYRY